MNDELDGIWKEAAHLRPLLSRHLSGLPEGSHDKPRSGQSVSWQRLEPSTSQIQIQTASGRPLTTNGQIQSSASRCAIGGCGAETVFLKALRCTPVSSVSATLRSHSFFCTDVV